MKLFLYSLAIFYTNAFQAGFRKSSILDYGVDWIDNSIMEKPDLRSKFLENKRKNNKSKERILALSATSDNVEYSEGIPHYKVSTNMKNYAEIRTMENNFKSMLKMNGVKYDYKRDMHWRTWREVTYPNKSSIVISYRCENIVNSSCETCHSSGSWAIEENLQCPYEIFSLKDNNEICAVDYRKIHNIKYDCPMTLKLPVLRECNNPLLTKYLVKRDFKTASGSNTVMCKEKGYCEIFTIYEISPNQTTFRLINSSNHVIYSRIMKTGGKNYICIEDCGHYDHISKKITVSGKPFIVNLLDKAHKNKREYLLTKKVSINRTVNITTEEPFKIQIKILKNPNYAAAKKRREEAKTLKSKQKYVTATTSSSCKKVKMTTSDYEMDEYFEEILYNK